MGRGADISCTDLAKSRRTFLLDVAYWSLYLREKPCIDREFPIIQRDAADCGAHLSEESFLSDFSIWICTSRGAIPLAILLGLRICAYQAADPTEAVWIPPPLCQAAGAFGAMHGILSVTALSSGRIPCKLSEISIDEMVVFRLSDEKHLS